LKRNELFALITTVICGYNFYLTRYHSWRSLFPYQDKKHLHTFFDCSDDSFCQTENGAYRRC